MNTCKPLYMLLLHVALLVYMLTCAIFISYYLGDEALIRDEHMPASVYAVTACSTACLDRASFNQMVGPISELLQRAKRGRAEQEEVY